MTIRPFVFYFFSLCAFLATPIILAVWYAHDPDLTPEQQALFLSVEPDQEPSTAFLHLLGFYAPPDQSSEEAGLQQWLGYQAANEQWLAAREAHLARIAQEITWDHLFSGEYAEYFNRKLPYDFAIGFGEFGVPSLSDSLECYASSITCYDWMLDASAVDLATVLQEQKLLLQRSQSLWAASDLGNPITWIGDAPFPEYSAFFEANRLLQISVLHKHRTANSDAAMLALHELVERQAEWLSGKNSYISLMLLHLLWVENLRLFSTIQDASESATVFTFTRIDFVSAFENAFAQEIWTQHNGMRSVTQEIKALTAALVPESWVPTVTGLFIKNNPSTMAQLEYRHQLKAAIEQKDKDNILLLELPHWELGIMGNILSRVAIPDWRVNVRRIIDTKIESEQLIQKIEGNR